MKKLTTLLICLLTAVSVLSQQNYPKSLLIDGDTVVAFIPDQVTKMNIVIVELETCKELKKSFEEENTLLKEQKDVLKEQKNNLSEQNETLTEINEEKTEQVKILTEENKKKDKRIKLLKKSRTLFTLGGILVGSGITYVMTLLLK